MKAFCQRYSKRKAKSRRRERYLLTKQIVVLKRKLAKGCKVAGLLQKAYASLKALVSSEYERQKVISRARWIEEGEKPTQFFFSLAKEHGKSSTIKILKDDNDVEYTSQTDKCAVIRDFYVSLFQEEPVDTDIQKELLDKINVSLADDMADICEGLLSVEEINSAMASMSLGKAPGEDGLTLEFFKYFSEALAPIIVCLANQCFDSGALPTDSVRGIIRLAFKKGDRADLRNWRPISLLNLDYKIIAKALCTRLKAVMGEIVNFDQTCSVKGRRISDNLNLIRDTLDHMEATNECGIVISLDQEKAFDRVDRKFLDLTLAKFGFKNDFRKWIKVLYNGACARVICNGGLTDSFDLEKGIRQGCSLSPLLYVLVAEVLAQNVRACKDIHGILVPGSGGLATNSSQYADDFTAIVKDVRSVGRLLDVVDLYGKGTGARLSRKKSEAMWAGGYRGRKDKPWSLKWVTRMKILGVWFGDNVEDEL